MSRTQSDQGGTSLTLLQRARGNDQDAWQRLIDLYAPFVHYWCKRWGVSPVDVEDVAQETFQAAAVSLDRFQRDQPGQTFRGWLRGITRNKVLLHFRRMSSHARGSGGTQAMLRLQQITEGTVSDEADSPMEMQALYQRALDLVRGEFEDRTWEMFWLCVVEGRAPVDLAEEMDVTPAAIRKAKSRVLRRLKEEVGELIT